MQGYPYSSNTAVANRGTPSGIIVHRLVGSVSASSTSTVIDPSGTKVDEDDHLRRARFALLNRHYDDAWAAIAPCRDVVNSRQRKECIDTAIQIILEDALFGSRSRVEAVSRLDAWFDAPDVLPCIVPAKHAQFVAKQTPDPHARARAALRTVELPSQAVDWNTIGALLALLFPETPTVAVDTFIGALGERPRCQATWRRFADVLSMQACSSPSCPSRHFSSYIAACLVPCLSWRDRPSSAVAGEIRTRVQELPFPLFDGQSDDSTHALLLSSRVVDQTAESGCCWCDGAVFTPPVCDMDGPCAAAMEGLHAELGRDLSKRMPPRDATTHGVAWSYVRRQRFFRRYVGQHVLVLFGGLHGSIAQEGIRQFMAGRITVAELFAAHLPDAPHTPTESESKKHRSE